MSKMGNLVLELQEQANVLGFSTVQEALDAGYVEAGGQLFRTDPQEQAHKAWLKEKDEVLKGLDEIARYFESMGYPENYVPAQHGKTIRKTIEFIKKGEV